jgi:hypothetical protein
MGAICIAVALAAAAGAIVAGSHGVIAPSPGGTSQSAVTFAERFLENTLVEMRPTASQDQLDRAKQELSQAMLNVGTEAPVAEVTEAPVPKIPLPRVRPVISNLTASLAPSVNVAKPPSADPLSEVSSALRKAFAMLQPSGTTLASASPDGGIGNDGSDRPSGMVAPGHQTALYDISARTVYMPDGTRLEAHSGYRELLDDVRYVDVKDRGATPPQVYELKPREKLFHGVQALRMTPIGEGDLYGRTGLLAHSYMLGPNGDSNGCVSFKDYDAFLRAFQNGSVKRLVVVKSLATEAVADAGKT